MSGSHVSSGTGIPGGSLPPAAPGSSHPSVDYAELREHEHHFNEMEMEVRKLASGWLLAALGAIAYFVSGQYMKDGGKPMVEVMPLIAAIGLLGDLGLFVLWILDQHVYHRLLQAAFVHGLRIEHLDPTVPPIRSLMMLSSNSKGISWLSRQYYFGSTAVLAVISAAAAVWQFVKQKHEPSFAGYLVLSAGVLAVAVPIVVLALGAEGKTLRNLAAHYGNKQFSEIVSRGTFADVVGRYHP